MAIARRLPGGYGNPKGQDAYLRRGESQYLREALIPKEGGWLVSTSGDIANGHTDITGVSMSNNILRFHYLPDRAKLTSASQIRFTVSTSVGTNSLEVGLFRYLDKRFVRVPGTYAILSAITTGQKAINLASSVDILTDWRLFLGIVAHVGISLALEGFQSGAAGSPRVIFARQISGVTAMGTIYDLQTTTTATGNAGTPMIAYLSKEATQVI